MNARLRRLVAVVGPVLVGLAATAFAWWRLGAVTRGTGWAEDAGIFLRERLAEGPVDTLLLPYAGYLHLLPRLTVDLGVALPIEDYALTVSAVSCGVAGAVCAAVVALARDVVPSWPLRLVLAVVPVVLPIVPYEVSGSAANQHWFMLALAPWLYAARPRSWWSAAGLGLVALVAGLTELQTALFLPLLLLAWLPWRDGAGRRVGLRALPVTLAAVGAAAAQGWTALHTEREAVPGRPSVRDVVAGWLLQPFTGAWTADPSGPGRAVVDHGWAVVVLPAAVLAVLVAVAVVVARWRARVLLVALGGASAALWVAAMVANAGADAGWSSRDPAVLTTTAPSRYAVAPAMLLLACVVVAASVLVERVPPARRASSPSRSARLLRIGTGVAGWCLVVGVVTASVAAAAPGTTRRSDGTPWRPQVLAGVERCRTDPARELRIGAEPWAATVPCALVLRGAAPG